MSTAVKRGAAMENKRIKISSKRQITIPQQFFDSLGFADEAECSLKDGALIIRPVRQNGGEFAEQILADLLAQGYQGDELLAKFKEAQSKVRPAVERMIQEADEFTMKKDGGVSLEELFDAED